MQVRAHACTKHKQGNLKRHAAGVLCIASFFLFGAVQSPYDITITCAAAAPQDFYFMERWFQQDGSVLLMSSHKYRNIVNLAGLKRTASAPPTVPAAAAVAAPGAAAAAAAEAGHGPTANGAQHNVGHAGTSNDRADTADRNHGSAAGPSNGPPAADVLHSPLATTPSTQLPVKKGAKGAKGAKASAAAAGADLEGDTVPHQVGDHCG
jgi:hypothetical protein